MKTTISALALGILLLTGCASTPPAATPTSSGFVNDNPAPPIPSTTTPTPTPTATSTAGHAVGEAVQLKMAGQDAATVTIVSAEYVQSVGSGALANHPKKGGFLVLDVLWETTAGVSNSNPYNFSVRDAAGHSGDIAYGTGDDLGSEPIPAGDKARGKVALDVGPGPWRLAVAPGAQPTYWTIPAA